MSHPVVWHWKICHQDTNDRFLANIQKTGTYSVIPRCPGGDITPDTLIAFAQTAKKYGLWTKITGAQRLGMYGAKIHDLPDIFKELVDAGMETGLLPKRNMVLY